MMSAPPLVVLAYCCLCLTNVTISFLYLSDVYGWPRERYKFIVYELFFLLRFIYDANVYYRRPATTAEGMVILGAADLLSLLSFAVAVHTFAGDKLEVFIVTFVVNIVTSVMTGISAAAGIILTHASMSLSFLKPFDASTVVAVAVSFLLYPLLKQPTLLIVRWVRSLGRRYLRILALLMLVSTFFSTQALVSALSLPVTTSSMTVGLLGVFTIVPYALVEGLSEREARERERIFRECGELVALYNGKARDQLALLERDHALFNQSEEVLSRLKEGTVDEALVQDIERLEKTYQQISFGTFCNQPSLDAVLASYAQRLNVLGVRPLFSAAGIKSANLSYTITTLALLSVATSKARSARHVDGSVVTLRLRSRGDGMVCHLQTPAEWGRLGVREFLNMVFPTGVCEVKERIDGLCTTVLVYVEDAGA